MADATVEFFQNQFTQEADHTRSKLLNNVPSMVSCNQNIELCRIPTIEKVKAAVFALSGESASGLDGFTGIFVQECWDIIGEDIHAMLKLFYGGKLFMIGWKKYCLLLSLPISQDLLRGKPANVVIKLDMAKAHDRVSWKYLMHVLRKMGFAECFINMIWNLISSNWYSVLINGQAS
ncbi:uncharacterized protein [Nicotiana tomentosiformis]|uniref:uncharacterized protein n=1 Tax=Nicotiana tomentosiformis TaxID=4098 RepID=UPI00388C674D